MGITEKSKHEFHKMLMDMRQELIGQVRIQDYVNRENNHMGDLGDFASIDMANEYAHMFSDRLRERVFLIDEALESIENGDYGLCEECGEPINIKRLQLMPFTRLCVPCQSEQERQARLRG
jgi:DnaK suppressor protein